MVDTYVPFVRVCAHVFLKMPWSTQPIKETFTAFLKRALDWFLVCVENPTWKQIPEFHCETRMDQSTISVFPSILAIGSL